MGRPRYTPPLLLGSRFPTALMPEQDRVDAGGDAEWGALDFAETATLATLALGPLRLRILGHDPVLGEALRRTWGGFLDADRETGVHASIHLRAVDRLPFETPVAVAAWARRDDMLLAKMRGLLVRVRPRAASIEALAERAFPVQDLGNLLRLAASATAPAAGALLVRTTAVAARGRVLLAAGAAHAGKSTLARLAAPRRVLTDDSLLVVPSGNTLEAWTAGFWGLEGSEGLEPGREPDGGTVGAVLLIEKAAANRVTRLARPRAALGLLGAVLRLPGDRGAAARALELCELATERVPAFRLEFHNRDGSCWDAVETALDGL